jgi:hypothetical protein
MPQPSYNIGMRAFTEWYEKNIYRKNAQDRVAEIDYLLTELALAIQTTSDPTDWNRLLARIEELQMERDDLTASLIRVNNA